MEMDPSVQGLSSLMREEPFIGDLKQILKFEGAELDWLLSFLSMIMNARALQALKAKYPKLWD